MTDYNMLWNMFIWWEKKLPTYIYSGLDSKQRFKFTARDVKHNYKWITNCGECILRFSLRYFCAVILVIEASTKISPKSYTLYTRSVLDNDAKGTQKRPEWLESEAHQVQSQAPEEKVHQIRGPRTSGFHVGCTTLRKFGAVVLDSYLPFI